MAMTFRVFPGTHGNGRLENAVCSDMGKSVLRTQTVPLGATVKRRKKQKEQELTGVLIGGQHGLNCGLY